MPVLIEIGLYCSCYYSIGAAVRYKELFEFSSKYELIDRLYRRYVRYEDLYATKELVEQIFDEISFDFAARRDFIKAYDQCLDDAERDSGENGEMYGKGGNYCRPIRIVNLTGISKDSIQYMFYLTAEGEIPLEDYDNLEGLPFWMRPEYVFEKY